ncbi:dihydroorotase [Caminicella sporogenes]|uniref:dihydroorotase n=1 Tax=Caminicella sporogenes TaxID=166485 RepID=UPI00254269F0|nr:dihydroorotase [Caminicella sporogenes]WIF95706.1 dihydroorotase [Caminicella sporogenes]
MEILIKNGRVIDPKNNINEKLDIVIKDGIISRIGKNLKEEGRNIINADKMIVTPGFIDIHVHLREPGFEYKETIETGTMAAAAGGFTTVACMPNTKPVVHSKEIVKYIKEKSKRTGYVNVLIIGSITKGLEGKSISDINEMVEEGIVAISDDGKTPMDNEIMIKAFKEAKKYNIPLISHCEEHNLSNGGSINLGRASERTGIKGIPSAAEYLIVKRDIELCEATLSKLHVAHVSTKESVELIRRGKLKGLNLTCEVAPHHFILTDDIISLKDTYTKVNPPLRTSKDVEAIIEGIFDGTIDIIATDHAPHDEDSKKVEYSRAVFGISGLETAFSLSYTELVLNRNLPIDRLVEMLTVKPAEIIGIDKGSIEIGKSADITIVDLNREYTIDSRQFYSKGKNTPFNGRKVKGKVIYTIVGGKVIYEKGEIRCL